MVARIALDFELVIVKLVVKESCEREIRVCTDLAS